MISCETLEALEGKYMQLFILRHGHAEPQQTTDEARNLTDKGRRDVSNAMKSSVTDLACIQEIWASPLVRAQQTAQIAQHILLESGNNISIKTVNSLVPESTPDLLFPALVNTGLKSVLLVSHQPFVGELLENLCGSEPGFHPFDTSTIACVDCEVAGVGMGTLRWLRHVHG